MRLFTSLFKKQLFVLFICIGVLSACEQASVIKKTVKNAEQNIEKLAQTISPDGQNNIKPLRIDNRPWFGSQAVPIQGSKALPSYLTTDDALVITFNGPQDMQAIGRLIEAASAIRVNVPSPVYEGEASGQAGGEAAPVAIDDTKSGDFIPVGGQEVSGGRVIWTGSLDRLLDQVASFYGAEWTYTNNVITISSELTKTFMLHALANELKLTGNASTSGGSSNSNIPEISMEGTATLEIWGEVSEAIERIIGDKGQASFSPSTGSITVTARPDILKRVENYLRYQNEMRLRRVAVSVKVLSIETADTQSYDLDITGAINDALGDSLSASAAANAENGLDLSLFKGTNATGGDFVSSLEANEGIRRVNIDHSGSLVTLSDQPAPLQVARQIAYLERVTTSTEDDSVSLEPGTVDLGLFMTVLPRIVQNDKILMRLSLALTDAETPFRSFGTTGTDPITIELPEVSTTGFLQNAVISDGETLVLSGFERRENNLNDNTAPGGFLFGGSRDSTRSRELLVLIINAKILPEQPITVIGQ